MKIFTPPSSTYLPGFWRRIAGLNATLAVTLGAFGAHGLREKLVASGMTETWKTASHYHLVHAVAILAAALAMEKNVRSVDHPLRSAVWCWLLGCLAFSGSLYALALGGPRWLGPITPIGGLLYILGWLFLGLGKSSGHALK